MTFRLLILISASLLGVSATHAADPSPADMWWSHVKVLADDSMQGRETGSAGMRAAQAYVVEKLRGAGLEPAGDDGFRQRVTFVRRTIDESNSSIALVHDDATQPLELGADAFFTLRVTSATMRVDAPLVFVGYGLHAPEIGHDDFANVDLKGKIAVFLAGSPADLSTALAGHYNSARQKAEILREHGAIGYIRILNPSSMEMGWPRIMVNRLEPAMELANPDEWESAGLQFGLVWNPASAEKLFLRSGHTFRDLAVLAKDRKPLAGFPLHVSLRANADVAAMPIECANIIARLPGHDPKLRDEYVVLSAHLDHLGKGAPVAGDDIYNGALDNASGSAALLELARTWHESPPRMRRSVLFVFVTAEEKGLLGSRAFTQKPTVPVESMIANVNVDMFLPVIPLTKLKVGGLVESDLGDLAHTVAARRGVEAVADHEPLQNLFIRSDQYSFILRGIPAVKLDVGFAPDSPEHAIMKQWRAERYHGPSDDLNQPVNFEAAASYLELVRDFVVEVANADTRPQWKPASFFRRYAR